MRGFQTTEASLFPKQFEFMVGDIEERIKAVKAKDPDEEYQDISCYYGGVGAGKTHVGALRGLCYALKWGGCRGLVGAKSQDLLDNTTKQKYLWWMDQIGLKENIHWWFTDRKQAIVFLNKSVIRFKTLSDWEQFMSEEFTWVEFE